MHAAYYENQGTRGTHPLHYSFREQHYQTQCITTVYTTYTVMDLWADKKNRILVSNFVTSSPNQFPSFSMQGEGEAVTPPLHCPSCVTTCTKLQLYSNSSTEPIFVTIEYTEWAHRIKKFLVFNFLDVIQARWKLPGLQSAWSLSSGPGTSSRRQ